MKLIIDIPDDVYERVKSTKTIETTDYDIVSLYRATKNGKPYDEPYYPTFDPVMWI